MTQNSGGAAMEDYPIIQAQTMLVVRFSCVLCVVSSFSPTLFTQGVNQQLVRD